MAPAFFSLAVTNSTAGTVGPAPSRASVRARALQLVFDGDLDEATITAATAAAPVLQTSGTNAPAVDGASLTLTYDLPLDPAKVPGADRYTLHYQLATGETDRDEYPRDTAAVAVRNKKIVRGDATRWL